MSETRRSVKHHRFDIGDRVVVKAGSNINLPAGIYTILRTLPVTNLGPQYRAQQAGSEQARILDESELSAAP